MKKQFWILFFIVALFSGSVGYYLANQKNSSSSNQTEVSEDLSHAGHSENTLSNTNIENGEQNIKIESEKQNQKDKKAKKPIYQCPMHPQIVSDHPGQCPICHMDLQLVDEPQSEEQNTVGANDNINPIEDSEPKNNKEDHVTGRTSFELGLERQQLIGVTYGVAQRVPLSKQIRATGKVAFDPELFTAIEEFRQSFNSWKQAQGSSVSEIKKQAQDLLESSKTKLKLMGLSQDKIEKLKQSGDSSLNLLLPQGKAWIYAEVFEYEMSGIKVGQKIQASSPSYSKEIFEGKISSISPVLNNPTRTIRVRAEVPDPKGLLRPDTFMNVSIQVNFGEKLVVPSDAVLFSEGEAFVFLVKNKTQFVPKKIVVGEKTSDFYEIVDGLNESEKIVTSANFLIDSESKLKSVLNRAMGNLNDQKHH